MIIRWLSNPELPRTDKLLCVLYTLGMACRHQLAAILNCSVHFIDTMINRLNKGLQHRDRYVLSLRPARNQPRMYYLGERGWDYISEWIGDNRPYFRKSKLQAGHYRGVNNILVRLIQQIGHDNLQDRLEWYSPSQAREVLLYPWSLAKWDEWKDKKVRYEEQRKLPWPDGRVIVDGKAYWVEYDNDTKNEALIKEQFRRYIEGLAYLPDYVEVHDPVIWVTPHAYRKNEMRDWWSVVKEEPDFTGLELIPNMFFFTEGEEVDFMLEKRMVQTG